LMDRDVELEWNKLASLCWCDEGEVGQCKRASHGQFLCDNIPENNDRARSGYHLKIQRPRTP
jgi:hypothetical protein